MGQYKSIPQLQNLYIIYENGDVWGLPRIVNYLDGRHKKLKKRKLKFNVSSSGYRSVSVSINGDHQIRVYIHQLVAQLFLRKPKGIFQVNHKDGNRLNNNVSNLEWVTPSENIIHSYSNGRTTGKGISRLPRKLILIKDVAIMQFESINEAIRMIGGSHSALSHVLHGRASTFKGFNAYFL